MSRKLVAGSILAAGALLLLAAGAFGFGTFTDSTALPAMGTVYQAAVGDVTGDGRPDIVAANDGGSNGFLVFSGQGDGKFRAGRLQPSGSSPEGIALGRFNPDKRLDVALSDYSDYTVSVFYGNKSGWFTAGPVMSAGPGAFLLQTADMNGDRRADLVCINYDSTGSDIVSVFLQKRHGGFKARADYPATSTVVGLAVGRINADKHPDVVTQDDGGTVSVFLGKADGTLKPDGTVPLPGGSAYNNVELGDFNGDGKTDLAAVDYTDAEVDVFRGKGNGKFDPHSAITPLPGNLAPEGVAAADFNRDGKLDLALAGSATHEVRVLIGRGNGKFKAHYEHYPISDSSINLTAGRLNGDKAPDLVVGTSTSADYLLNKRRP